MTATLPPDDAERLRKVLALLSSPHSGEAMAALDRMLAILGKHRLRPEDMLGLGSSSSGNWHGSRDDARRRAEDEARQRQEKARQRREDEARWHAAMTLDNIIDEAQPIFDLWEAAKFILAQEPRLPQRSMDFLRDLVEREYRGRPSERQAVWLRDLARTTRRQVRDRGL